MKTIIGHPQKNAGHNNTRPGIHERIHALPWEDLSARLQLNGYAEIPSFFRPEECASLSALYGQHGLFRKTVIMERHRFGKGEYKYFNYPLPGMIQELRQDIYPFLVPVANNWAKQLGIPERFPPVHQELLLRCRAEGQRQPTPLILKYGESGYNTLHQDLYGKVFFPLQLVLFLKEVGRDYSGGEFVLTEQRPRAQSRVIVLKPNAGDMLLFPTNFRPEKGKNGYYRLHMKHGVSEVREGERITLGIIFHDAEG